MALMWKDVVAQKRDAQASAIAAFTNIKTDSGDNSLLDVDDAALLTHMIVDGRLSAERVTQSYIASFTEILFEDASRQAHELDKHLAEHGGRARPLHGVPMTLKDQFNVKGYDTTIGYVGRALSPATEDATIVKMLKSLGAVILAKTNLPQSIMWCETENPLWGLTTNPLDPRYTPGGSTGGESALLALKGSMVGWGTDIGGSVRIPAHMMGIYGFKPSSARLPYNGVPVSTEGQEHVPSAIGPLARSLASIHAVMKALITAEPWTHDARCVPIPWREDVYQSHLSRPLTIGVLLDDGVVRPHPPITRVLQDTVNLLQAAGHIIVPWDASLHAECIAVMDAFYTADGGEDIRRAVAAGGEPFIPHVERLIDRGEPISVYEYWQLNRKKWALQQAYLEKWKNTAPAVDVIIMPPMPHTSVPHGGCKWVGYTKVWNVLDYTSLVLPAGRVKAQDSGSKWEFNTRNEMDEWNANLWKDNKDDMIKLGLPVGVQIIGRKLEEEKVLAVGKVIDKLIKSQTSK